MGVTPWQATECHTPMPRLARRYHGLAAVNPAAARLASEGVERLLPEAPMGAAKQLDESGRKPTGDGRQ